MNEDMEYDESNDGEVDWEELKAELLGMSDEVLTELLGDWLTTYRMLQNYWRMYTDQIPGIKTAADLDHGVWCKAGPIQAYRVKQALGLSDDIKSLSTMLKFILPQWVSSGFEWEFMEITDRKLVMTIHKCPMGTYRKARKMELMPCRVASPPVYEEMANVINERLVTTCLHAYPDPPEENVMCRWEFLMED